MGEDPESAIRNIDDLELQILPCDAALAREAADLCPLAWTHALSFGDRACLATARRLHRTALTADRRWLDLPGLGIDIRLIR